MIRWMDSVPVGRNIGRLRGERVIVALDTFRERRKKRLLLRVRYDFYGAVDDRPDGSADAAGQKAFAKAFRA